MNKITVKVNTMKIKFIKDAPQNHEGDELELDEFHASALIAMGFAEEYKKKNQKQKQQKRLQINKVYR